jgi:glycosyltransferase involved in cell wall biosynthesis
MSKVSVIIPIYNVEKYIKECLDSVINQSLKDIEIICVDDGGKDNCPKIIDEYAKSDDRIVVIHKENGGYGNSCNVGLERASGEYISIVEPDDFIDKNMLLDLHDEAVRERADIVKTPYIENYDLGEKSFQKLMPDNKQFRKPDKIFCLSEYPEFMLIHPSIWSCLYRREFLIENNIKFVEAKGAGWTDNPFQVQTMCLAKRIKYVDKAYYYWRKTNLDDAKDLKDITIPFKRYEEINSWLKSNDIDDCKIRSYLLKRQIVYLHNINRVLKLDEIEKYLELIKGFVNSLDYNMINESTALKMREKRFLYLLKKFPIATVVNDKLKMYKRNFIKIRWNKKEHYISILGKTLGIKND